MRIPYYLVANGVSPVESIYRTDVPEALALGYYINFVEPIIFTARDGLRIRMNEEEHHFSPENIEIIIYLPRDLNDGLPLPSAWIETRYEKAYLVMNTWRDFSVFARLHGGLLTIADTPTTLRTLNRHLKLRGVAGMTEALAQFRARLESALREANEEGVHVRLETVS